MEINGTFIYILFAIAYVIFQIFSGKNKNKKKKQVPPPRNNPKQPPVINSDQEEITSFEDLFKTITQANPPSEKTKPVQPTSAIKSKEALEKAKAALKKESHRIKYEDNSLELVNLEEVDDRSPFSLDFDIEDIDWPKAIVTKEILDRKYV